MRSFLRLTPAVLLAFAAAVASAQTPPSPEKIAKVCAQSEARYIELFGHPPSQEPVTVVTMYKYTFCPQTVTVPLGSTVRWINIDKRTSHSTWFRDAGKPESDRLFPEEVTEMTFDVTGEYGYLCGPHWESDGMIGKVIVTP